MKKKKLNVIAQNSEFKDTFGFLSSAPWQIMRMKHTERDRQAGRQTDRQTGSQMVSLVSNTEKKQKEKFLCRQR